jgi:hypothetical protein
VAAAGNAEVRIGVKAKNEDTVTLVTDEAGPIVEVVVTAPVVELTEIV